MPVLIWISGPPAAGKSTLSHALAATFEKAMIIPVDDLREWVVSGNAGPVPWTDETERQYVLSEEAACGVAERYVRAGFDVIIDSCRNPAAIDQRLSACVPSIRAIKVLLMPSLADNLHRAHTRTNKPFPGDFLDGVIEFTNDAYRKTVTDEWLMIDNSRMSVEEEISAVMATIASRSPAS